MFSLSADKNQLSVLEREPVTSGSVNVYEVRFAFSVDWDGLKRTAVFKAGGTARSVPLDGDGRCSVPWEVLRSGGWQLYAGVYGTRGADLVLPTVWASLGVILEGAKPGEETRPSAPEEGGGEGGTSDHRVLVNRDAENQHPISSIVNLEQRLETIPRAMTADELRKILMS